MEDSIKKKMIQRLDHSRRNSLWVKVTVKVNAKTSYKIMSVDAIDDEFISFKYTKTDAFAGGDDMYRCISIYAIKSFTDGVLPEIIIKDDILPLLSKDSMIKNK
jgi:hypothetical protein